MSGIRSVMKEGWHPKGKDGKAESWRGDYKGINQVVSLRYDKQFRFALELFINIWVYLGGMGRNGQRHFRVCKKRPCLSTTIFT